MVPERKTCLPLTLSDIRSSAIDFGGGGGASFFLSEDLHEATDEATAADEPTAARRPTMQRRMMDGLLPNEVNGGKFGFLAQRD